MAILRVEGTDGRPLAAVLNDACHPVSLGSQCTDISADFPGTGTGCPDGHSGTKCGNGCKVNPLAYCNTYMVPPGLKATPIGTVSPVKVF